jgi:signal transduction histidine kinase
MPVDDVEKIFLPFDEGGETIGLPFCYRLLRTMGGSLAFEQKDGTGVFTMSVPRGDQPGGDLNPGE